jgi:hypothetical protein
MNITEQAWPLQSRSGFGNRFSRAAFHGKDNSTIFSGKSIFGKNISERTSLPNPAMQKRVYLRLKKFSARMRWPRRGDKR